MKFLIILVFACLITACGGSSSSSKTSEADKKELRSQSSLNLSDDKRYYFTVRCNWLKTVIQEPLHLQKCEGKKPQGSSD